MKKLAPEELEDNLSLLKNNIYYKVKHSSVGDKVDFKISTYRGWENGILPYSACEIVMEISRKEEKDGKVYVSRLATTVSDPEHFYECAKDVADMVEEEYFKLLKDFIERKKNELDKYEEDKK